MSAPAENPQSRIAETAPPDATSGLDPLPPKPQEGSPAVDLQAIRLAGVATTAITERLRRHGVLPRDDEQVLGEVAASLSVLLDEVERLSQEVTAREAAARHALDAATQARGRRPTSSAPSWRRPRTTAPMHTWSRHNPGTCSRTPAST